jgi:hypothetical protein
MGENECDCVTLGVCHLRRRGRCRLGVCVVSEIEAHDGRSSTIGEQVIIMARA